VRTGRYVSPLSGLRRDDGGGQVRHGRRWNPYVNTGEKRTGLLGKLGMNERKEVTTVMCPECGLIRHYAEFEEE